MDTTTQQVLCFVQHTLLPLCHVVSCCSQNIHTLKLYSKTFEQQRQWQSSQAQAECQAVFSHELANWMDEFPDQAPSFRAALEKGLQHSKSILTIKAAAFNHCFTGPRAGGPTCSRFDTWPIHALDTSATGARERSRTSTRWTTTKSSCADFLA